jgi:molecular chaperone Hsp33
MKGINIKMNDHLVIATAYEDTVRVYTALTTQVVDKARLIHQTWPTATAVLGRLLTGALIMGVMSDNPHRLTVKIAGEGPVGEALAVSNYRGKVKGCLANPQVDLDLNAQGKFDVAGAVGRGFFTVTKDLGLKEPYQGVVPLQSGEVAEDFAFYFSQSEQIPSAVALGVLVAPDGAVKTAGGFVFQLMPDASEQIAIELEAKLAGVTAVTDLLEKGKSPLQLIKQILGEQAELKVLEKLEVAYECDCSRERFLGPLLSLGQTELDSILAEQGQVEVRCHFCNQLYRYYPRDLAPEASEC